MSKARIAEVVSEAVSPKAATELGKMKKADAAAAAELRLAKVAWVPEILCDRETPATPAWESRDDADEDAEAGDDDADTADGTEAPEADDAGAEPEAGDGTDHVNDTPPPAVAAPVATSPQPPWPFPTADSMNNVQSGPLAA